MEMFYLGNDSRKPQLKSGSWNGRQPVSIMHVKEHFNIVGNCDSMPMGTSGDHTEYVLLKEEGCWGIYPSVSLVEVCPHGH